MPRPVRLTGARPRNWAGARPSAYARGNSGIAAGSPRRANSKKAQSRSCGLNVSPAGGCQTSRARSASRRAGASKRWLSSTRGCTISGAQRGSCWHRANSQPGSSASAWCTISWIRSRSTLAKFWPSGPPSCQPAGLSFCQTSVRPRVAASKVACSGAHRLGVAGSLRDSCRIRPGLPMRCSRLCRRRRWVAFAAACRRPSHGWSPARASAQRPSSMQSSRASTLALLQSCVAFVTMRPSPVSARRRVAASVVGRRCIARCSNSTSASPNSRWPGEEDQ